ncbi:MAG: hypothetical protein Q4E39_03860 [bacterium]|nr:hypothetical protein [bacterium]
MFCLSSTTKLTNSALPSSFFTKVELRLLSFNKNDSYCETLLIGKSKYSEISEEVGIGLFYQQDLT